MHCTLVIHGGTVLYRWYRPLPSNINTICKLSFGNQTAMWRNVVFAYGARSPCLILGHVGQQSIYSLYGEIIPF